MPELVNETNETRSSVLGTFEGECADADITNKNGLDITREVWQHVFESEDYKQAIDLGWLIGFLGHPEDPGCMDFEHACIVMREGHLEDNGKVYGRFDLVDTPVGRIVKSFIDAGVTFGISVRGAGDIIDNSVDPESFVFRGFDLVSFPAYPEAIPTFSEIAASTDLDKQVKYKKVCACVRENIDKLSSASSIDVIQCQFAKQSEEYRILDEKKKALSKGIQDGDIDISDQKIRALTELYLSSAASTRSLQQKLDETTARMNCSDRDHNRKLRRVKAVASAQLEDLSRSYEQTESELADVKKQLTMSQTANLKYKQKINSATSSLEAKDRIIASLKAQLSKTVEECSKVKSRVSDLDAYNQSLTQKIQASTKLVKEYQQAYANFYSNATGIHSQHVTVSDDTSVADLRRMLSGTSCKESSNVFVQPDQVEVLDADYEQDDLVTL